MVDWSFFYFELGSSHYILGWLYVRLFVGLSRFWGLRSFLSWQTLSTTLFIPFFYVLRKDYDFFFAYSDLWKCFAENYYEWSVFVVPFLFYFQSTMVTLHYVSYHIILWEGVWYTDFIQIEIKSRLAEFHFSVISR